MDRERADRELLRCCGSIRWARRMTDSRPFDTFEVMSATADDIWWSLDRADWLEAFAAHPQIGAADPNQQAPAATPSRGHGNPRRGVSDSWRRGWGPAASAKKAGQAAWSSQEQWGVSDASSDVRERLASRNRDYVERFGYIFIICATGKSAEEMLATLEQRLTNAPDEELRIAAEEQRRITQLRLRKLLDE